jgi:hypothetical protein
MSFRKAVLAGAAAATAGIAITATTAMASPMGGTPTPFHKPAPENFTISINGLTNTGTGNATGPVHGAFTEKDLSNTDSQFDFANGSVDVWHTDVSNLTPTGFTVANSCTGTVSGSGTWAMFGRSGVDRHAKGTGTFTIKITEVLKENTTYKTEQVVKYIKVRVHDRHGHDEYSTDRYGRHHAKFKIIKVIKTIQVPVQTCDTNPADAPVSVSIAVTGTGTATNGFQHAKI